ncbi:MAG TPA: hypothetical protein VHO03_06020 [Ignavibacteriales bacterium]|nr:hypothetical protein [Ignavibacteriales bacterium]
MIISDGRKHAGQSAELVVLSDPYYVKLVLDYRNPEGDLPLLRQEFMRLIAIFDQKKFKTHCRNCPGDARLLAFYKGTLFFEPWCSECTPYWVKKEAWKLDVFSDYLSALDYVDYYCHGERMFYKKIIRNIARLKGLPKNLNASAAERFFNAEIPKEADVTHQINSI